MYWVSLAYKLRLSRIFSSKCWDEARVETKTPFFIFEKGENSHTFHKISFSKNFCFRDIFRKNVSFRESFRFRESFPFRESFRETFLFIGRFSDGFRENLAFAKNMREKFSLSRKFLQKFSFSPMFRSWIHIQLARGSRSAFRMENFR
jgi:hypothetical protein